MDFFESCVGVSSLNLNPKTWQFSLNFHCSSYYDVLFRKKSRQIIAFKRISTYADQYACVGERIMQIFPCDRFSSDVGQVSSDANDFPKTSSEPIYKRGVVIKPHSRAMYSVHWAQSLDIGIAIAITCNTLSMECVMVRAWIDARMFNVTKSWGMFHPFSIDGVASLRLITY